MASVPGFLRSVSAAFTVSITLSQAAILASSSQAYALDLDWTGQFRSEAHFIYNYAMTGETLTPDPALASTGGYNVLPGGSRTATFQPLFMRVFPKVIVNDNIYIKTEWWLGNPVYGMFGDASPFAYEQRSWLSTHSRGSIISAQRFWAELLTDIGTVQVGRAPMHWGLGLHWHSGDGLWDRYQSTGDTIRLVSRFGAFTVIPSVTKYSQGNNIGGNCAGAGCASIAPGSAGVSDYAIAFKYHNLDEDLEAGALFNKRLSGAAQDPVSGFYGIDGNVAGMNYNIWDLYARKKLWRLTFGAEVPITTGTVGPAEYKTFAVGGHVDWEISDSWNLGLKSGHAPGNPNADAGATPTDARAFYFHQNNRVGLIMFNYQFANFAGRSTSNNPTVGTQDLVSPWDNPIVNTTYLNPRLSFELDKWTFSNNWVFAFADEKAEVGKQFFNPRLRQYVLNTSGQAQESFMGFEVDLGVSFQWDESFHFGFDTGVFKPGTYYNFSNGPTANPNQWVFAAAAKAGITF